MLESIDSDELTEWMAIRKMGFDEDYIYLDAAQAHICQTLSNINRSQDSAPYSHREFLLWPPDRYRDTEEMSESLLLAMDSF